MKAFFTLSKYERRSLFPSLNLKRKPDIIGGILSLLVSALVIGVFLLLVSAVADSYVVVKINKVSDPMARSAELLNVLYSVIIIALAFMCLEKMRKTLASKAGKEIFLRLPVSQRTIFLSKLSALMLWTYVAAAFFILPVNVIFYFILSPGLQFWVNTLLVLLFLPLASFLIATILLIPYIKVVEFLSTHYFLTFILMSGALIGAFFAYTALLKVIQNLFETGSIKFLFNQSFVDFLQGAQKFAYPANVLAYLALGKKTVFSLIILSIVAVLALVLLFLITNALYKVTLYKNSPRKNKRGGRHVKSRSPMMALMRKEFISVFRDPKNLFSYFTIAIAMPFMVYCCFTLFETLLINAIGRSFQLALSLLVMLVFSILTNTFCATNISRDGAAALKAKIFPIKASTILLSKVLFCNAVSSLSVIASAALLFLTKHLTMKNALIACGIGLIFSISQILIATRMDLNHARVMASTAETEKASSRTIAKTITIGLFFAAIIGFLSLFISVFVGTAPSILGGIAIKESYSYLLPLCVALFYLLLSCLYYFINISKSFNNFVR